MTSSTRSRKQGASGVQPILLDSDLKNLVAVRKWLRALAEHVGLRARRESDLMVAVGEAVTNCVKHAYHSVPGGKILLSCSIGKGSVTIHVRDWGDPFILEEYIQPDLTVPHEGGYGVYLMRQMVDGVEISTDRPPGTEISLTKKIEGLK